MSSIFFTLAGKENFLFTSCFYVEKIKHICYIIFEVSQMKRNIFKYITSQTIIIMVAILMALSYQLFIVPNNFAPAGLNGIATMVQYKTGFSIGYISLIINIPLCVFAFFAVNKKYAVSTLIFSIVYSVSFLYFQQIGLEEFQYNVSGHNTIFPVILSGAINGFVYGICFWKNASTGGTDIVSKYISIIKPEINFFWMTFILNTIVAIISFFVYAQPQENGTMVYNYNPVVLCVLYCFLSSFIGNIVLKGTRTATKFTIITDRPNEIVNEIEKELKHGSTQIKAVGSYTKEEKSLIICIVNKHQIVSLQSILSRYENTFSFSEVVNETYGNFKKIR